MKFSMKESNLWGKIRVKVPPLLKYHKLWESRFLPDKSIGTVASLHSSPDSLLCACGHNYSGNSTAISVWDRLYQLNCQSLSFKSMSLIPGQSMVNTIALRQIYSKCFSPSHPITIPVILLCFIWDWYK
jgi:hypothetical protein